MLRLAMGSRVHDAVLAFPPLTIEGNRSGDMRASPVQQSIAIKYIRIHCEPLFDQWRFKLPIIGKRLKKLAKMEVNRLLVTAINIAGENMIVSPVPAFVFQGDPMINVVSFPLRPGEWASITIRNPTLFRFRIYASAIVRTTN